MKEVTGTIKLATLTLPFLLCTGIVPLMLIYNGVNKILPDSNQGLYVDSKKHSKMQTSVLSKKLIHFYDFPVHANSLYKTKLSDLLCVMLHTLVLY